MVLYLSYPILLCIIIIIVVVVVVAVAMIPMTRVLERMEGGYQLKKGGSRIDRLMFMDDIKLG